MEERSLRKSLWKRSIFTFSIIQVISLIILFLSNALIETYFLIFTLNLLSYYLFLTLPKKKIFDSYFENKNKKVIKIITLKNLILQLTVPIIILVISFKTNFKLLAFGISIILFSLYSYFLTRWLMNAKIKKINHKDNVNYFINNKFFTDTFLITIPFLMDVHNMIFSFYNKHFFSVISFYFFILIFILLRQAYLFKKYKNFEKNGVQL